ncbi:hypothetical protein GNP82_19885 [Aliivibrio fischeri]|uniref:hypothetical protein n=1 Tax=Aliivibrio fischeri TaxID=668 RepID=UPI0012D97E88|nr:hypothetical protein [Aliivibrio fischeri]MUK39796.1 hypothetical protein [Aliivibrio fischeri]MUL08118.1 hypothetical protein [Aliivibrio fischeri]
MTEQKEGLSSKEVEQLSGIEFQSQSYASFYNTTMEKDKSILTLSVAGIGFLVTLLKLTDKISYYELMFFILASLSFLISIYCIITIFGNNSDFIIDLVHKRDVTLKQYKLDTLDKMAIRSFYLGIIMSLLLGASTSITLVSKGDNTMTNNKQTEIKRDLAINSCNRATDLHESFQGAASLQGTSSNQTQTQSQSQVTGAAAMMPPSNDSTSGS